jgi:hypothetical protein
MAANQFLGGYGSQIGNMTGFKPFQPAGGSAQQWMEQNGFGAPPSAAPTNPWLQQQGQNILGTLNQNLQTQQLPAIRAASRAVGGYGDSRQGIAEGMALQGVNRDASNALASLYGQAYENDANRANQWGIAGLNAGTTMRGQDMNFDIAGMQDATTRFGQQLSADTSRYTADTGLRGTMYASDNSLAGTRYASDNALAGTKYSSDNALAGTRYSADQGAAASRYASDNSLRGTMYGADTSMNIAGMNDATNRLSIGNNFTLGLGNLGVAQQNANTGQQAMLNQNNLGLGQLALGNRNADISGAIAGSNIFSNAVNNGINWNDALYRSGQQQMYAPMGPINAIGGAIQPWAGLTGTGSVTTPSQGGGASGALGGAIGGAQLWNLLFGGGS